jgi:transposase
MSRRSELFTDEQWAKIEASLPKEKMPRKKGRPRADDRRVIEGVLWVLRTGACWTKHMFMGLDDSSICLWRELTTA